MEVKIKLNNYQRKQMKYVNELKTRIVKNKWQPMDLDIECRTCNVKEHITSVEGAKEFMEKHAGHFTWVTNNNQPKPVDVTPVANTTSEYDDIGTLS